MLCRAVPCRAMISRGVRFRAVLYHAVPSRAVPRRADLHPPPRPRLSLARGPLATTVSAHPGQRLVPLPEGAQYLGFLFARAESSEAVEAALRTAHDHLEFVIEADKR